MLERVLEFLKVQGRIWNFKHFIKNMFLLIFYIGCWTFVIHRGYKCMLKYLLKPQGIEMSYDSSGNLPFPHFTFCPHNWNDFPPKKFNENVTRSCNITWEQYVDESHYVGFGGTNCTNPKILQKSIGTSLKDMDVNHTKITTYDRYMDEFNMFDLEDDTYFEWISHFLDEHRGGCHTFSLKKNAMEHEIRWVTD